MRKKIIISTLLILGCSNLYAQLPGKLSAYVNPMIGTGAWDIPSPEHVRHLASYS